MILPQIKLEDAIIGEGPAIGMGSDHYLNIVESQPRRRKNQSYARIAGDEMVVGIDVAGTDQGQTTPWYTVGDVRHAQSQQALNPVFVPSVAQNLEIDPVNDLQT